MKQITELVLLTITSLDEVDLDFTHFVYDTHNWEYELNIDFLARYCEKYFYEKYLADQVLDDAIRDIVEFSLIAVDWYDVATNLFDHVKPAD